MNIQHQLSSCTLPNRYPSLYKYVQDRPIARILSFGCSSGEEILTLKSFFPTCEIVGIDISAPMIEKAREKLAQVPGTFVTTEIEQVRARGQYDLITCFSVLCIFPSKTLLYSWENYCAAMSEMISLLSPRSYLLVFNSNYSSRAYIEAHPEVGSLWKTRTRQTQVPLYLANGNADPDTLFYIICRDAQDIPADGPPIQAHSIPRAINEKTLEDEPTTRLGILGYSASSNIGDYMQTLAQLNIWSFFYLPEWKVESPAIRAALEYFSSLKPSHKRPDFTFARCNPNVTVEWVDRDTINDPESDIRPIWVIMNGWYAHRRNDGTFSWPPRANIRPLFVSFHIQTLDFLDPHCIEYFARHGPVGCRDINTQRLLTARGIESWFSGCLTTTLDSGERNAPREGNYSVDILPHLIPAQNRAIKHLAPEYKANDFDTNLSIAQGLLIEYARAESLHTSRLHVFLPSIAAGLKNASFSSPNGHQGPSWMGRARFEGLIDRVLEPRERELYSLYLTNRLLETIGELLIRRAPEDLVYKALGRRHRVPSRILKYTAERRDLTAPIAQNWAQIRLSYPAVLSGDATISLPAMNEVCLGDIKYSIYRSFPLSPYLQKCAVLITIDDRYVDIAIVMLRSLSLSNPHILWHVNVICRNVGPAEFARLRQATYENIILHRHVAREEFANYKTHLHHVSESCLDRLFVAALDYPFPTDRIIYLDCDLLVLGPLDELLSVDTGNMGICARSSQRDGTVMKWLENIGSSQKYPYKKSFNAGVFVTDISTLKSRDFTNAVLNLARQEGINDQIILNLYSRGAYKELPAIYNVFVNKEPLPPRVAIVHFVGSKKPWNDDYDVDSWRALWNYYSREEYETPIRRG